ncbi:MAG: Gfo/Idh/MocA family oxidoreductase [Thiofilum sp.]|uniref:Gfo/Idh/MocA family protein n=1 Tax=Thiofilum sp. TaxID=2212733 RepID=UPI0025CDAE10|nr:Gfo/Idh/MocA family oxidoreductase [Thiofilum sp.]MBK8452559.1 Gfo/Idh/MocA family oxidoreductase [Thiofilum sp.]
MPTTDKPRLNWGILSTAKIARTKVIPALQKSAQAHVYGIASRDGEKAKRIAQDLAIPHTYDSYEALLADPNIQVVYIPLPNDQHIEWTQKALQAGKHVLCEKPIGLNSEQVQTLQAFYQQLPEPRPKVMEAFMYRFHAQWQMAKALVQEQRIGELKAIQTIFSYFNADPNNIRNSLELGGGALMDIGCYGVSLARFLFGQEPQRVCGMSEYDPAFGVDRLTTGLLDFGSGQASFTCATQMTPFQRVQIYGTQGRIELEIPFNAPPEQSTRLWVQTVKGIEEHTFAPQDQYTLQAEVFTEAILKDQGIPMDLAESWANMRVMDAIVLSAQEGCFVAL